MAPEWWGCHDGGMEWITAWLNGISDTWLRVFALAGVVGLGLGAYQMVTGWRANKRQKAMQIRQEEMHLLEKRNAICLKGIEQFLYQHFGDRAEIRAIFEAPAPEMTVSVGKRPSKKPTFRLTLRRLLGKLFP